MKPDYLVLVARDVRGWTELVAKISARTGLKLVSSTFPAALLAGPSCGLLRLGEEGALIGSLFWRQGPARPLAGLDADEEASVVAGKGHALLTNFWGGYVAMFTGGEGVRLMRDPSGALPCYLGSLGECDLAASDVHILLAAGIGRASVDWQALARHLFAPARPGRETVLAGISELLPGFAVDLPGGSHRQHCVWSPWDHVRGRRDPPPPPDPERLRRVIRQCVSGWTSGRYRIVLSLSGGLDSSVVAACLPDRSSVTCLTLYDEDPVGDERGPARLMSEHLGLSLVEEPFRLEDVDIEAPLGAHLPRPFGFSHALAYERAHEALAEAVGADAFVTGNGGDNVFGHSQSAAAIADRFLSEGLTFGLWRTLSDVCLQTGCGAGKAARAAMRLARAPAAYRWRGDDSFLHEDVLAQIPGEALCHPWLVAPPDALPGRAAHIASLLRVQLALEPPRSRVAPVLNPLLSQPVIEACLAISSWDWRAGGADRSVVRRAFTPDLPEAIVRRRTKGSPDAFAARLLRHHAARIRERLLDGRLVAQGLLDRRALETVLGGGAESGDGRMRILELLATEAWLDSWA